MYKITITTIIFLLFGSAFSNAQRVPIKKLSPKELEKVTSNFDKCHPKVRKYKGQFKAIRESFVTRSEKIKALMKLHLKIKKDLICKRLIFNSSSPISNLRQFFDPLPGDYYFEKGTKEYNLLKESWNQFDKNKNLTKELTLEKSQSFTKRISQLRKDLYLLNASLKKSQVDILDERFKHYLIRNRYCIKGIKNCPYKLLKMFRAREDQKILKTKSSNKTDYSGTVEFNIDRGILRDAERSFVRCFSKNNPLVYEVNTDGYFELGKKVCSWKIKIKSHTDSFKAAELGCISDKKNILIESPEVDEAWSDLFGFTSKVLKLKFTSVSGVPKKSLVGEFSDTPFPSVFSSTFKGKKVDCLIGNGRVVLDSGYMSIFREIKSNEQWSQLGKDKGFLKQYKKLKECSEKDNYECLGKFLKDRHQDPRRGICEEDSSYEAGGFYNNKETRLSCYKLDNLLQKAKKCFINPWSDSKKGVSFMASLDGEFELSPKFKSTCCLKYKDGELSFMNFGHCLLIKGD